MFANCHVIVTTALMVTTVNVKTKNTGMIGRQSKFNKEKGYGHHRATRGDIQEQREGIKDLVTKDALLLHQAIP